MLIATAANEDHRSWSWVILVAATTAILVVSIGVAGYWTIPAAPFRAEGDPLITYDREIGFVPRPHGRTRRIHLDRDGRVILSFHVFNDRRGARVTRPGMEAPTRPEILFVGDSFTWGQGVENEDTFADRAAALLGAGGANVSMGSYGTTQSLQMLRRNQDLAPTLVVYSFITDHLERNVQPCARSVYPFCMDVSHVVWDPEGRPRVAPPWSDGATRARLQARADDGWLDPVTWVVHGVDVVYGRVLWTVAKHGLADRLKREQALEYLLGEMVKTAESIASQTLVVYIPQGPNDSMPDALPRSTTKLRVPLLDLSATFRAHRSIPGAPPLYIPNDGHPSVAGHALVADEIASFVRQHQLLGRGRRPGV
jgi:hypothetical protein